MSLFSRSQARRRPVSPLLALGVLFATTVCGYFATMGVFVLDGYFGLGMAVQLFFSSVFCFALPGLVSRRAGVGRLKGQLPTPNVIFCAAAIAFACQPLVEWASAIDLRLCETIWNVEGDSAAENAQLITELCNFDSFTGWLVPTLVIALAPAVSEELFFRGAMIPILRRLTGGWGSAVFISAVVFSLAHFDMTGFVARTLMGLIMGIVFVLSRSLWVSMAFHFANNFLVLVSLSRVDDMIAALTAKPQMPPLSMSIISLVLTVSLIFIIHRSTLAHRDDNLSSMNRIF